MTITIEFFGILERLAGRTSLPLELTGDDVTVQDALAELARKLPDLSAELPRAACAVGDEMVLRDQRLAPGVRLALLPPVAGG